MKKEMHKQCRLRQYKENSTVETVAWIPVRGAKVGYKITLEDEGFPGEWTVVSAGDTEREVASLYDGHDPSKVFKSLKEKKRT